MNLLKHVDIIRCTSGTHNLADPDLTSHVGPAVDMKGYEGALCIFLGSSKLATGATTALAGRVFIGATTAALLVASGTISVTAATSSSFNRKCVVMDVYKPTKRYIQPRIATYWATSADDNNQWLIVKYGSRRPGSTSMMAATGMNSGSGIILSPTT
jgi:hypothetical protein